ncbi:MAG: asparaginase domain-containing protein [Thermohalobaculum sp.]|nr:asparaginase domain-containing protein [Thermohalobaculum sp.]
MRVALAYTGGTIGSIGQPLDPMPAPRFRDWWARAVAPGLPGIDCVWAEFEPPLDSSQAEPADWVRLARTVLHAAAAGARAVVVLHGTDTMASSAAALGYLTTLIDDTGAPVGRLDVPVILTGAQRPLFGDDGAIRPGSDAPANVRDALAAAATAGPGVHLVFAGRRLPGPRALKVSVLDDRAFDCPNGLGAQPALPPARPAALIAQLEALAPALGRRAVLALGPAPNPAASFAAMLAGALTALGDDLAGLLLLGYGTGNLPATRQIAPLLRAAHDRGVLLAIGTQVPAGAVAPGIYGAGAWLDAAGVLATGDMTMPAAQAKLHLAAALAATRGWPPAQAGAFFLRPIAGERSG